jgi:hypothetical protein
LFRWFLLRVQMVKKSFHLEDKDPLTVNLVSHLE